MACRKVTFSVPSEMVEDLDYLSKRIKVSRSALLSQIAAEPIATLRVLVSEVPENPTEEDLIRAKGRSISLVESRIENIKGIGDDLFSGNYKPNA